MGDFCQVAILRKSFAGGAELEGTLQLTVTTCGLGQRNVEVHIDVGGKTYSLKDLSILGHSDHLRDIEPDRGLATFTDNRYSPRHY